VSSRAKVSATDRPGWPGCRKRPSRPSRTTVA